jgi:large subunit ribosomal protein L19e
MKLTKIKKIAERLLGVGESKLWFNPAEFERITEAMTTEDIRALIKEGIIKKKKTQLHSRGSARILKAKKNKGRKRGFGKRTGTKKARVQRKQNWTMNVRAQRKHLRGLKQAKKIDQKIYSKIYNLIKGGYFKGKRYIDMQIETEKKSAKKNE